MPASYLGTRQGSEQSGVTSYALKSPTGTAVGDLVLFAFAVQTEAAVSVPGMTVRQLKGGGFSYVFATAIASGSEPTYTASWSGGAYVVGHTFAWNGNHASSPIAAEATGTNAEGTAVTWPSISPEIGDCLDVIVALSGEQVTAFPEGFTERLAQFPNSLGDRVLKSPGATGEAEGTQGGVYASRVFRFAIAPEPGEEGEPEETLEEKLDAQAIRDALKEREEDPLSNEGKWALLESVDGNDYTGLIDNIGEVTLTGWTTQTASKAAGAMWVEALLASDTWSAGFTLAADLAIPQHLNVLVSKHEFFLARVAFGSGWYAGVNYEEETVTQGEVDIEVGDLLRLVYFGGDLMFMRRRGGAWSILLSHTAEIAAVERHAAFLFYPGAEPNPDTGFRVANFVWGSLDDAPVDLAATLSGDGSLSAELTAITTLSAGLAGAGSLSAELEPVRLLAASLSGAGSLSATLSIGAAAYERIAVRQEYPPDKIALHVQPPQGAPSRWAADEALIENVMDDYRHVSEMNGGYKESSMTLARDPRTPWSDLAAYSKVSVYQPGVEEVFAGRLDKAPESDGDHMSISPEVVGPQAALEDDKSMIGPGFIDRDLSKWQEPSVARRVAVLGGNALGSFSATPDATTGLPGLVAETREVPFTNPRIEAWFDSGGEGIKVAALQIKASLSGFGLPDAALVHDVGTASDDLATGFASNDLKASNGARAFITFGTAQRMVLLRLVWVGAGGGTAGKTYGARWQEIAAIADHGLSLQGDAPNQGFTAKQMLEYAVPLYTSLTFDPESEDDDYIIQQAWFSEPGDMATVVRELTKYGLLDWFVYEDEKFQLRFPGTYGRRWQAYAGPSELKEAGLDASRLWRSIVVRFQDVDGSTRTVGPPGSGATVEDAGLEVTDPDHPAVKAGLTRKDILDLGTIAVPAEAIVVGERWLEEANLLSRSGSCNLTGYVLDDRGIFWPAAQVKAGDYVRFNDAGDSSYRKITRVDYTDAQKQAACSLDGPPQGLQALLERFQATLTPLGLR